MDGTNCPWEYRVFDLIQNKQVAGWTGSDAVAPRKDWGAFDSSALVNAASDTLIEPAENGLVYKAKLNASFDPEAKTVSVNPQLTKMEYRTPSSHKFGIESSAVAYRNLMFASDNDGNLAKLSSIASALGFIGDQRTIAPLKKMLLDSSMSQLSRAFAAVALGGVADKESLPWNSKISTNINYRASVDTLTNKTSGILDIL